MTNKIKIMLISSALVTLSACSNMTSQKAGDASSSSKSPLFGQKKNSSVEVPAPVPVPSTPAPAPAATCAPCNNTAAAPKPRPVQQRPSSGAKPQQWYINRWRNQQAQGGQQQNQNTTQYYDYSSEGKGTYDGKVAQPSNKSIYSGQDYKSKTYQAYEPKTYSAGNNAQRAPAASSTTSYSGGQGGTSSYTVKKGDTVFEVMRRTGVYWKDIIKMNNLQAPAYTINPGQVLRLK